MECHVHIWQMSPQLSCGDICQIWMWFKNSNMCFCKIENVPNGKYNKWTLSNPHPWTLINDQFDENLVHYCVLKPYKCDSVTPIKIPTLLLLKISNILFACITNMKKMFVVTNFVSCTLLKVTNKTIYSKASDYMIVTNATSVCVYVCLCVCVWGTVVRVMEEPILTS